jgi:hypothetical protein
MRASAASPARYYTEKDLTQPRSLCPMHKRPVESMKEESYLFRLSRYQAPRALHEESLVRGAAG